MTWFRSLEGIEWFDIEGKTPADVAAEILAR
jgi:hypothetical protein